MCGECESLSVLLGRLVGEIQVFVRYVVMLRRTSMLLRLLCALSRFCGAVWHGSVAVLGRLCLCLVCACGDAMRCCCQAVHAHTSKQTVMIDGHDSAAGIDYALGTSSAAPVVCRVLTAVPGMQILTADVRHPDVLLPVVLASGRYHPCVQTRAVPNNSILSQHLQHTRRGQSRHAEESDEVVLCFWIDA